MPTTATDLLRGSLAGWRGLAVAAVIGAAASLSFAPVGWWPLAILAPAFLVLAWGAAAPRRAAALGFAFAAGLFGTGTYWLYTAVHDFGGAPAALAVFLMLGLVALMASYYAILGYAVTRWTADGAARRLVVLPAGWLLLEWLRGWLFTGFPWLEIGYAPIDTPLAGLAPVAGVHAMTLAAALSAGVLAALVRGATRERVAACALLLLVWVGAGARWGRAWTSPSGAPLGVALVQGAIPQDLKWQADNREATLALYERLTTPALGRPLIVWPEAALPLLEHEAREYLGRMWGRTRASGSDLVLGLLRYDFESRKYYNGMVALSDDATWYYKRRLVPFGEFFPVPETVRGWMRLMSLPYVDMTAGPDGQAPLRAAGQLLGATICYEDAYGAEQLAVLGQATLLVNVTNNAWFGDSTAPHQQLQMARLRALEAGRFLARATSNGVTAVIGPDGAVRARIPQFVPGVLYADVVPHTGLTPYARTGDWPVLGLALFGLLGGAFASRRRGTRVS
ncbi:MAG: apolipoprotein N-acyltransferase [Gammaproteobacteria bacterium]|nr:apolipoprotein N-acyltransferase [Gammaproteobacteria bacterium]